MIPDHLPPVVWRLYFNAAWPRFVLLAAFTLPWLIFLGWQVWVALLWQTFLAVALTAAPALETGSFVGMVAAHRDPSLRDKVSQMLRD